MYDEINKAKQYNQCPSGVECKDIAQHYSWCLGNVIKYIWRAKHKGTEIKDLEKAQFYLYEEICRLKSERANPSERNEATQSPVIDLKKKPDRGFISVGKNSSVTW